jgi:hypothetical protein
VLRACRRAGPGRPPADAGVRDDRPGHRHEPAPVRALRVGRRPRLRPRQGDDCEELEAGKRVRPLQGRGRRRHPLAHLPGTHPTKGAFFTRGTTRDPYARYSERGPDYIYNMDRLLRKFDTPPPWCRSRWCAPRRKPTRDWRDVLRLHQPGDARGAGRAGRRGHAPRRDAAARLPLPGAVREFIASARPVFVVEQNRDAQMRSLLVNELDVDPAQLIQPVLHYDGTPITARFITAAWRQPDPHVRRACPGGPPGHDCSGAFRPQPPLVPPAPFPFAQAA